MYSVSEPAQPGAAQLYDTASMSCSPNAPAWTTTARPATYWTERYDIIYMMS